MSGEISLGKSIFMYLLVQFWYFEIFFSERKLLRIFLQIPIDKVFSIFCPFWLPQFKDKIYPLTNPLGPSNVNQDLSREISLEKSIFMYFLVQFWYFEICFSERKLLRKFFTDSNPQSIFNFLSFLTPSIQGFSKIWALVKSGSFAMTHFS